ncbi:MAG: bifunctional glutamate N-acetyltransferase/amino-acid acetyltransferase ArgJ [Clostridia bacterium]|nr:bifunctional glutamate N-acetyltransferase/amino-acid acetyltransferase ArgJ [Clostridia bacterium]
MKEVSGGVCAPKGFRAAGVHCGVRKNKEKRDLALILSDVPCTAAAVYTQNKVKGAPLLVTRNNLSDGVAQAVICNSGNANTCNSDGVEIAQSMCALLSEYANIPASSVIVASTGVIGQPLPIEPIKAGMAPLVAALSYEGSGHAAEAIMTTDTAEKSIAVEFTLSGVNCTMGGIAKGSGMIHPNMATMLVFLTTDAAISAPLLQKALSADILDTFNMVSVDGDTSTNDMVSIMANGMADNPAITEENADCEAFAKALNTVTRYLCRNIAKDGEGATKLLTCIVTGAVDTATAKVLAKSVIASSLVKAAMFGSDANWGRVLCALGYSGAKVDVDAVDVSFASKAGEVKVCVDGRGVAFSEEKAKTILSEDEIEIRVSLHEGTGSAEAWGCDLTYDYVKINGDYRT